MKISLRVAIVVSVVAGLVFVATTQHVQAQTTPMTQEHIERIKANCLSAKTTLDQLHRTDAVLRVNRGQLYESVSTKLMARFNSRVALNRLDGTGLVAATVSYERTLAAFRADYIAYEQQLSAVLRIDCSKEPVAFYDGITATRIKRSAVHADIVKLHEYIDSYQTALTAFSKDYKTATESIAQ